MRKASISSPFSCSTICLAVLAGRAGPPTLRLLPDRCCVGVAMGAPPAVRRDEELLLRSIAHNVPAVRESPRGMCAPQRAQVRGSRTAAELSLSPSW